MPERSVGRQNKCMRFLKSLFGRGRKGKYDLAEANRQGGISEWDAEEAREQSRARKRKSFFSRRRHNYELAETSMLSQSSLSVGSYTRSTHFVSQTNTCTNNSAYVAALHHEGLLQWPYSSENTLPEVTEHPVLSLCYGFRDQELRENRRKHNTRCQTSPIYQFDQCLDSWVQSGLNHILIDEVTYEDDPIIDNMPVSFWMAVIEPALQALLTYRFGRNKRLNITSKRQQTPMNSVHNASVRGDNLQQNLMLIGPPNQNWALGLVAVFAMRIGELGERQHRYIASANITDVQIPDLNPDSRLRNRHRNRATRATGESSVDPDNGGTRG